MPWYKVTLSNGASKTYMAASPEQARQFAEAEVSSFPYRHSRKPDRVTKVTKEKP